MLLDDINDIATVLSQTTFNKEFPHGKTTRNVKDYVKTYFCRRACDHWSSTYSDDFIWEDLYFRHSTEENMLDLLHKVEMWTQGKKKTKRKRETRTEEDAEFKGGHINEDELLKTPRKKQKTSAVSTPRKQRTPSRLLTPSHKRFIP